MCVGGFGVAPCTAPQLFKTFHQHDCPPLLIPSSHFSVSHWINHWTVAVQRVPQATREPNGAVFRRSTTAPINFVGTDVSFHDQTVLLVLFDRSIKRFTYLSKCLIVVFMVIPSYYS